MPTEKQYGNQTRRDAVRSADKELRTGPRDPVTGKRGKAIEYVGDEPFPEYEQLTDVQRESLPAAYVDAPADSIHSMDHYRVVGGTKGGETAEEMLQEYIGTIGKVPETYPYHNMPLYDAEAAVHAREAELVQTSDKKPYTSGRVNFPSLVNLVKTGAIQVNDPKLKQLLAAYVSEYTKSPHFLQDEADDARHHKILLEEEMAEREQNE